MSKERKIDELLSEADELKRQNIDNMYTQAFLLREMFEDRDFREERDFALHGEDSEDDQKVMDYLQENHPMIGTLFTVAGAIDILNRHPHKQQWHQIDWEKERDELEAKGLM